MEQLSSTNKKKLAKCADLICIGPILPVPALAGNAGCCEWNDGVCGGVCRPIAAPLMAIDVLIGGRGWLSRLLALLVPVVLAKDPLLPVSPLRPFSC